MNHNACLGGALALLAAGFSNSVPAQADVDGRQYASLSAFSWDGAGSRLKGAIDVHSATTADGYVEELEGDGSGLGLRILLGFKIMDWLGAELHVAGGSSDEVDLSRDRIDFDVTFPDDFDFGPFMGLTPQEIAALDPSVFEGVEVDVTETRDSIRGKVKLNQAWGLFLRPNYTFFERFNVYALAGMSYSKLDFRAPDVRFSRSNTGLAYGAGIEFGILPGRLSATLDFVQYADEDDVSLEGTSLGLRVTY